jgi:hypothetical protein
MHALIRGTAEIQIKREDVTNSKMNPPEFDAVGIIPDEAVGSATPIKIINASLVTGRLD